MTTPSDTIFEELPTEYLGVPLSWSARRLGEGRDPLRGYEIEVRRGPTWVVTVAPSHGPHRKLYYALAEAAQLGDALALATQQLRAMRAGLVRMSPLCVGCEVAA